MFRAVDRAMYFDLEEGDTSDPYEDDPWRRGNLHLSAPCIYARVVEALELKPGLSFLNLGSGTGYLNTIIGLLVGPNGLNHGIEYHPDVVEYAHKRLQQFKQQSYAIDKYEFSEPIFIKGNCLNINPNSRYDRIYLGAACLPEMETFMKKLISPNGGILVMPYENHLTRYIRHGDNEWKTEKLMNVNFTLMIRQSDNETIIDMPLAQARSLKEICRTVIRQQLRSKTDYKHPNLMNSDNVKPRRIRKAKAQRRMLLKRARVKQVSDSCALPCDRLRPSRSRLPRSGRSFREAKTGSNNCQRCGKIVDPSPSTIPEPGSSTAAPSRVVNRRVMTRSASRRLSDQKFADRNYASRNLSPPAGPPTLTLRNSHLMVEGNQNSDSRSSSDEDGDDDDDDGRGLRSKVLSNCARTRPFICSIRDRHLPTSMNRTVHNDRTRTPRIGSIQGLDLSASSSSSPSSLSSVSSLPSSISDLSESRALEEYGSFVERHVVWPGLFRMHNDRSPSSLDSGSDLSGIYDDSDTNNEASWDSFSSVSNESDFSIESTDDSQFYTPTVHLSDSDDIYETESLNELSMIHPQPSTSRDEVATCACASLECEINRKDSTEGIGTHEPVASRLRSRRVPSDSAGSSSGQAGDTERVSNKSPTPSCSHMNSKRSCRHKDECPVHKCRAHSSNTCSRSNIKTHKPSSQSNLTVSSVYQNSDSAHSSLNPDSDGPSISSPAQSRFTGRILIAAGLGTALTLATHRYLPTTRFNGSFRLFERRSLESIGSTTVRHNRNHTQLSDRKRKRHSSSESSSDSPSTSRDRHPMCNRRQRPHSRGRDNKARIHATGDCHAPRTEDSVNVGISRGETSSCHFKAGTSFHSPPRAELGSERGSFRGGRRSETKNRSACHGHNHLASANVHEKGSRNPQGGRSGQFTVEARGNSSRETNAIPSIRGSGHSGQSTDQFLAQQSGMTTRGMSSTRKGRNTKQRIHESKRSRPKRKRNKKREGECKRYHSHISGYISQLPLPRVLHSYLNYDRDL